MKLIILQGESTTGKTTLASWLAKGRGIKVFSKDTFKEEQFDVLGKLPNLYEWLKIERDSWQQIYKAIQASQKEGEDLIIEGNFGRVQRRKLKRLVGNETVIVELFCLANRPVVLKRYRERYQSSERHKGHRDHLWYPALWLETKLAKLGWYWIPPLQLSSHTLKIDTADFAKIDYSAISRFVEKA